MGPCDSGRFDSLNDKEREFLTFEAEFCLSVLKKRPYQFEALQAAANALTGLGYYEDGLCYDMRLSEVRPHDPVVMYNLACSFSLVGNVDRALDTLENAICLGYNDQSHMVEDPDLERVKEHPRFKELVEMIKKYVNKH